jgi:hypothetical protein
MRSWKASATPLRCNTLPVSDPSCPGGQTRHALVAQLSITVDGQILETQGVTVATRGIRRGKSTGSAIAPGTASRTARQRIAHDAFDATCAPAALRAAAQAGIHLTRSPDRSAGIQHCAAYVAIAQHVARTDDHDRSAVSAAPSACECRGDAIGIDTGWLIRVQPFSDLPEASWLRNASSVPTLRQ